MSHTITDEQIAEAVKNIDAMDGFDPEIDHADADAWMLTLLPPEVRDARARAINRAHGWWYA